MVGEVESHGAGTRQAGPSMLMPMAAAKEAIESSRCSVMPTCAKLSSRASAAACSASRAAPEPAMQSRSALAPAHCE